MWTGRELGKTVIVGGYSPHIHSLPKSILTRCPVIGINRWPVDAPCDYWIGLDTGLNWEKYALDTNPVFADQPKFLPHLTCPRFMRTPNEETETFVPKDAGVFFDKVPYESPIPREWTGQLLFGGSSAIPAIHLAIILGAAEIILYGVDFVGNHRADGSQYVDTKHQDFWHPHLDEINNAIRKFQTMVPIYKTHPDSKIECPYLDLKEL